jgi:hypothetical protein
MLCAIFESDLIFQRRRAGLLPPRKCTSGRGAGRGSAPESEMTGRPPQQASSAMTMRAVQLAQAAEHRGPGVAAGFRGAGAGMSSPSCIGTGGDEKPLGTKPSRLTRPASGKSGCPSSALACGDADLNLHTIYTLFTRDLDSIHAPFMLFLHPAYARPGEECGETIGQASHPSDRRRDQARAHIRGGMTMATTTHSPPQVSVEDLQWFDCNVTGAGPGEDGTIWVRLTSYRR